MVLSFMQAFMTPQGKLERHKLILAYRMQSSRNARGLSIWECHTIKTSDKCQNWLGSIQEQHPLT